MQKAAFDISSGLWLTKFVNQVFPNMFKEQFSASSLSFIIEFDKSDAAQHKKSARFGVKLTN